MKVAVVGGGFTGCMAALHSAYEGHEVELWESSVSIGGVLRDIETPDGTYFNGCQYLRKGMLTALDWPEGFIEFPHEYGALTALGNSQIRIVDDCAQPALDNLAQLSEEHLIDASALQRLHAYGPHAKPLIDWAQSFGDLARLDWRCLIPMQLSRMYFPEDGLVPRLKADSLRANELLAIPRRLREQTAESAWLPKGGYNALFARLHQTMRELGVSIKLSSPIKPAFDSEKLSFWSRSETLTADAVVWTSNPLPLFNRIYGIRMETPPVKMKVWVGDLRLGTKIPVPLPYYWQVFETGSSVVRLYLYELGGAIRYSAETFGAVDDAKAWLDLQQVMHQCGLGREHRLVDVVEQLRYVNFSPNERHTFEASACDLLKRGVVPGGWQHYGREEKVNYIIPLIDQCLKLRAEVCNA
jgi:hypothetical protein